MTTPYARPRYNRLPFGADDPGGGISRNLQAIQQGIPWPVAQYDLRDFLPTGYTPGKTSASGAIQAAVTAAVASGGGIIGFPPGTYYCPTTITGNPVKTTFLAMGASGFGATVGATGDSLGAVTITTDSGSRIFDFGDNTASRWNGPSLVGLGFRDLAGTSPGAVRITRMNMMDWRDVSFTDFTTGYAWEFDGGSDWVQYVDIYDPRVSNCKYGYKKTAKNSDIRLYGGLLQGNNISGGIGIWEATAGGGGGRLRVFGTGFNWWETGISTDGWNYLSLFGAVFEQPSSPDPSYHTGTAIGLGNSTASSSLGLNAAIVGCHFDKFDTAISNGSNVVGTTITAPSAVDCTTFLTDSGTQTNYFGHGPTATPLGLQVSGQVHIPAGLAARAGMNIAVGSPPTSPNDGDLWYESGALKFRLGGTTKTFTLA